MTELTVEYLFEVLGAAQAKASQSHLIDLEIHDDVFDPKEVTAVHQVTLMRRGVLEFDRISNFDGAALAELVPRDLSVWRLDRAVAFARRAGT